MADLNALLSGSAAADPNTPSTDQTWEYTSVHKENPYSFMSNAYFGKGGFRDGTYLIPHVREMFYTSRRDFSHYSNYVRPIVDAMYGPVFGEEVAHKVVSVADESVEVPDLLFEAFLTDCDLAETSLQDFVKRAALYARLHGLVFVVVDNFPQESIPPTVPGAAAARILPYVYIKKASQLLDEGQFTAGEYTRAYSLSALGELTHIIFTDEDDPTDKDKTPERWRLWTAERTVLLRRTKPGAGELVEVADSERFHGLGRVPVVVTYIDRPETLTELMVDPPLYDLARANLTLYNKESEIRNLERSQGFSLLYWQTDDPQSTATVGDKNVLYVPMLATISPGYASPNPEILNGLVANAKSAVEDIYRMAAQQGVTGVVPQASGLAKQWDFRGEEAVLKDSSALARRLTRQIGKLFGQYVRVPATIVADYPDSFAPDNKAETLTIYQDYLMLQGLPASGQMLALERITRLVFADEAQERVDEVIEDLRTAQEDQENMGKEFRAVEPPVDEDAPPPVGVAPDAEDEEQAPGVAE